MLTVSLRKNFCPFTCLFARVSLPPPPLPFLVHAPGAVQEIQEEHNGYPSEAEADQVASCTCSSVCSYRPCI